jgi:biotin carboxyl carrier protein
MIYKIGIGNSKYEVEVGEINEGVARVTVNGDPYEVLIENYEQLIPSMGSLQQAPAPSAAVPPIAVRTITPKAVPATPKTPVPSMVQPPAASMGAGAIVAPIPGLILDVKVKVGDSVNAGQTVATMEAMKMENNIISSASGMVKEIRVQKGSEVATGDVIMVIE